VFGEFVVTAVPEASSFLIGGLVCCAIALKTATRAFRSRPVA
jgi:hypothetical protein